MKSFIYAIVDIKKASAKLVEKYKSWNEIYIYQLKRSMYRPDPKPLYTNHPNNLLLRPGLVTHVFCWEVRKTSNEHLKLEGYN